MIHPMQVLCFFLLCVGTVTASVPLETFVRDYCITCHGPEKQKGNIRFDGLKSGDGNPLWHDIYEHVARGDMPPRKAPKIPDTVTAKQALEQIAKDLARSEPIALGWTTFCDRKDCRTVTQNWSRTTSRHSPD